MALELLCHTVGAKVSQEQHAVYKVIVKQMLAELSVES
jgi:hypothetical protein